VRRRAMELGWAGLAGRLIITTCLLAAVGCGKQRDFVPLSEGAERSPDIENLVVDPVTADDDSEPSPVLMGAARPSSDDRTSAPVDDDMTGECGDSSCASAASCDPASSNCVSACPGVRSMASASHLS
jgi:hypothetical protein